MLEYRSHSFGWQLITLLCSCCCFSVFATTHSNVTRVQITSYYITCERNYMWDCYPFIGDIQQLDSLGAMAVKNARANSLVGRNECGMRGNKISVPQ